MKKKKQTQTDARNDTSRRRKDKKKGDHNDNDNDCDDNYNDDDDDDTNDDYNLLWRGCRSWADGGNAARTLFANISAPRPSLLPAAHLREATRWGQRWNAREEERCEKVGVNERDEGRNGQNREGEKEGKKWEPVGK